jgi:hypothetical protein
VSDVPAGLKTERASLAGLFLYGKRYARLLGVFLKPPVGAYGSGVNVEDDTAIEINGRVATRDELIEWAKASGEADVVITRDPMRYGRCVKLEFIEAG